MNIKYIIYCAAIAVLLAGAYLLSNYPKAKADALNPGFTAVATSTQTTVGATNTLVSPTSSLPYYNFCMLQNNSSTTIFVMMNQGAPAAVNTGIMLNASSTYEMYGLKANLYRGTINAVALTGGASLLQTCY